MDSYLLFLTAGSCSLVIEDDHSPTECLLQLTYTLAYARRDVRREVCNANMLLCGLLDSAKREAASHFSSKIHRRGGCTSSQFIIKGLVSLSNVILASFDVESCNEVDLTKGWPRIASHLAPVPNISVIPDLELKVSFSVKEYGNLGVSLAVSSDDERNGDVPRPLSLTTFEYVQEKLNSSISGCHKMDAGLIEMAYSPDTLVVGDWLLDVLTQVLSTTNFSNTNLSGDRHLGKRSAQTQPPEAGHCELQQFQVHNSDIHNFHVNPHPLPSSYQGHTPTGRPRILYPKWLKLNYCQGRHGLHYYGKQDKLAAYSQLLATSINGEHIGYTPRCLPFTYAPILLVVSNINVLNPTVIANDLQVASCHWQ